MNSEKSIEQELQVAFDNFLKGSARCQHPDDQKKLHTAFTLACEAHKGMKRKNGDPFITHPLEVAKIITHELGLGTTSAISALLHHIFDVTDYELDDLESIFGEKVSKLLGAIRKVPEDGYQNINMQAETFRKLLLTLSDDVRVVFIKLADRLHNMRTIDALTKATQLKIAKETADLYAPLAHRLGLYSIKVELEDLSFKILEPDIYNEIAGKLKKSERKRNSLINRMAAFIMNDMFERDIKYDISGRTKSICSIARKIEQKKVAFEEIYDLLAVRIIFDPKPNMTEQMQCWEIYTIIRKRFTIKENRIRDWISKPKENGYEALHLTVRGPENEWVEIQIRSRRMHEIAEKGYAAHWKYKGIDSSESAIDNWIDKTKQVLESTDSDALRILDKFKMSVFSSEIIAFTPKGDVKTLPQGATVLDFAFAIHSDLGMSCIGAQIETKVCPAEHVLQSGDTVKILTSKTIKPSERWLDFLVTEKAKAQVANRFREFQDNPRTKGKAILQKLFSELQIQPTSTIFKNLFSKFDVQNKNILYEKIGGAHIGLNQLETVLKNNQRRTLVGNWKSQFSKFMSFAGRQNANPQKQASEEPFYIAAECCYPVPGDEIIGFYQNENRMIIHKATCKKVLKLSAISQEKTINAIWKTTKIVLFLARIKISGIENIGLVSEITHLISKELMINMKEIKFKSEKKIFNGYIDLYIHNLKDLNAIIHNIRKMKGVKTVERVNAIDEL